MNKTNLIQALEAVLDELRKPTITFTPLKQEPLDDREISHGFRISKKAIHAESFWIGVKFAEKEHGVGVSRV